MQEQQGENCSTSDPFNVVMPKEHTGCVRLMGKGVTNSDLKSSSSSTGTLVDGINVKVSVELVKSITTRVKDELTQEILSTVLINLQRVIPNLDSDSILAGLATGIQSPGDVISGHGIRNTSSSSYVPFEYNGWLDALRTIWMAEVTFLRKTLACGTVGHEKKSIRPTFSAERIFGGTLLAMCSNDFICFKISYFVTLEEELFGAGENISRVTKAQNKGGEPIRGTRYTPRSSSRQNPPRMSRQQRWEISGHPRVGESGAPEGLGMGSKSHGRTFEKEEDQ
ncbi:Coatomer subunit beta'-3 [Platanthera zijinensis]|uniref:Coatomer subunit beta'-3 n=1 Tax=Platanthera zijinensis TaxID=2320716 RepID=A0AAP0GGB3_9ASPA